MQLDTLVFDNNDWKFQKRANDNPLSAEIVFIFGDREAFKINDPYTKMRKIYPNAEIVGCSSSGNILGDQVSSAPMVATATTFKSSHVKTGIIDFKDTDDLEETGYLVTRQLPKEGLKHVLILSDGLHMNGSALARGANRAVDDNIPITGGLAGDGIAFEETYIIANDIAKQNRVVAVGFYGENITISSGCYAGWDEFGVLRTITRSEGNVVYEIDHQPALELYKKYLGEYASDLPSSGLRFPMSIKANEDDTPVIRSVLLVDEQKQSLTFAGDVPQGYRARLMKTDIDGLIDGSQIAAGRVECQNDANALAVVISCVGRRLVLNQLTDEELESISATLGSNVQLTGFYSYGELAPFSTELMSCHLHNQTMTLTVIYEEV